jgi:hypothetical protein
MNIHNSPFIGQTYGPPLPPFPMLPIWKRLFGAKTDLVRKTISQKYFELTYISLNPISFTPLPNLLQNQQHGDPKFSTGISNKFAYPSLLQK